MFTVYSTGTIYAWRENQGFMVSDRGGGGQWTAMEGVPQTTMSVEVFFELKSHGG